MAERMSESKLCALENRRGCAYFWTQQSPKIAASRLPEELASPQSAFSHAAAAPAKVTATSPIR